MIKSILFLAGAAMALPAAAQVTSMESSNPPSLGKDPNRKICERTEKIGSRLQTTTVCMTAREWQELRRTHRNDTEKVQQVIDQKKFN